MDFARKAINFVLGLFVYSIFCNEEGRLCVFDCNILQTTLVILTQSAVYFIPIFRYKNDPVQDKFIGPYLINNPIYTKVRLLWCVHALVESKQVNHRKFSVAREKERS